MAITLIEGFYCGLPREHLGSSDWGVTPANDYQKHNATQIRNYLQNNGFTLNAVCGILGCMQTESYLSPSCIEGGSWSAIPNNSQLSSYQKGIGLVQWTSTSAPPQKLIAFCDRYSLVWYHGNSQLFRIKRERETDIQFNKWTVDGVRWDWETFASSTIDPAQLAKVWDYCYEVSAHVALEARKRNATQWFNYFQGSPPGPGPGPDPTGFPYWLLFKFRKGVT